MKIESNIQDDKKGERKRKKQLNITWGYRFFNKKTTTQNHNHRFTENSIDSVLNKIQNTKKREGYQEMSP